MSEFITNVSDASFDQDVIQAEGPVLVDYWAEWCGPCRMVSPIVDQIADENSDKLTVVKVNTDDNLETASKYGITSIPALYVFKDGEVAKTIIGARPKPALEEELAEFI